VLTPLDRKLEGESSVLGAKEERSRETKPS